MKQPIKKQFHFTMALTDYIRDEMTGRTQALHTGDLHITYEGTCRPDYLNEEDADIAYDAEVLQVVDMYGHDLTGIILFSSLFEDVAEQIHDAALNNCPFSFTEDRIGRLEYAAEVRMEEQRELKPW